VPHWLEAGRQAFSRFALAAAVAHFERGVRLARELPAAKPQLLALLLALAEALRRIERAPADRSNRPFTPSDPAKA
jgi:predicted ATPase